MATRRWLDTSSDWNATANWSGGAVPTTGDTVHILEGSRTIDTNLPGSTAGVDYAALVVGPNFAGKIGTSTTTALYVGTVPSIVFDGARCQECYIHVDTGDTVAAVDVWSTGPGSNALHLLGPGTITALRAKRAAFLRIGSTAVITAAYIQWFNSVATDVRALIESGAAITTLFQLGGVVDNYAAQTTVHCNAGTFNHLGESGAATYNIATANIWGGRFNFYSEGGTITAANLYNGTLDTNGGKGLARVITTLNLFDGSYIESQIATVTVTTKNDYSAQQKKGSGAPGFGA